jgi:hypothetical protein
VALAGCSQQFGPHAISVSQKRKGLDAKPGAGPHATFVSAKTHERLGFAGLSFDQLQHCERGMSASAGPQGMPLFA